MGGMWPVGGCGWGDACREWFGIGICCVDSPCYVAIEIYERACVILCVGPYVLSVGWVVFF